MNQTVVKNDFYEVLTDEGWKSFDGVLETHDRNTIQIKVSDSTLICTEDHRIKIGGNFVQAKSLKHVPVSKSQKVYDLINVADTHSYITNDIISHNCLFIDEAAFIENWDEFFKSTLPTISSGSTTKVILVSTPNGLNHFHAYWEEAKKGKNGYNPIQVMWYDVPGRNEKWKTEYLKSINNDEEQFAQEMCCEFHGSSGTLIAGWKLKTLIGSIQRPIAHNAGLYQYQKSIDGHTYACIVDVSHGKGLDHSAFHIIDITKMPYEQVCVYRNNTVAPFDYAETIFQVVKSYNSATILVEINDLGHQVADHLFFDFEYEGVLFTQSAGRDGKRISTGFGDGNVDKGIRTTKTVKAVGCSILKLLIEQDQLIIHDHETIYELGTFSRKGKSYEAEPGKHDDLVMGLVLFAWLSDQKYFKDMTDIHTLTKLREKTDQEIMAELTPFGIMDDGRGDEDETAAIEIPYNHDQWMN